MPLRDLWRRSESDSDSNVEPSSDSDHLGDSALTGSDSALSAPEILNELKAAKRKAQTEKARAAALLARQKKKAEGRTNRSQDHPAAKYKPDLQPNPDINRPGNFDNAIRRRRVRLVYSWFRSWCSCLLNFLRNSPTVTLNHAFTVNVVDDTSMSLADLVSGAPQWRQGRMVSVLNNIESVIISYSDSSGDQSCSAECKSFLVHTPLVVLPKTNTYAIVHEIISWFAFFLGTVGARFQVFGLASSCLEGVPIQGTVICWDSLSTNMAILKRLRFLTHMKHQTEGYATVFPLYSSVCALHQLALARRPCVYHFQSFWSSITRLAHLFEVSSFRQQFRSSLIRLIVENFEFVDAISKPAQYKEWRSKRNQMANLYTNDSSYSTKRRQLHMDLLKFDNGDPASHNFCHWCDGSSCCSGNTANERKNFALLQICKGYVLLFSQGYPCPLLYRWTHAHRALQYTKDPWLACGLEAFVIQRRRLSSTVRTVSDDRSTNLELIKVRTRLQDLTPKK